MKYLKYVDPKANNGLENLNIFSTTPMVHNVCTDDCQTGAIASGQKNVPIFRHYQHGMSKVSRLLGSLTCNR